MSKGFLGSLAAIFGLAALLAFVFPSHGDAALDQWVSSAQAELHSHQAFVLRETQAHQRVTRLQTVAAWWQDSVISLQIAYKGLQAHADSLLAKGDTAGGIVALRAAGESCEDSVRACHARGDSLQRAVTLSEAARFVAVARADSADSLLRLGVGVKDCRFLLLKCPTRTQTFGLGAGIATLVFVLLKKF